MSARARIIASGAAMAEGRGDTAEVLAWWNVRIHALWRLRLAQQVSRELAQLWQILDNTFLRTDASGTPTRRLADSPLVPFSLLVLHAKEPRARGDVLLALDRLTALRRRAEATALRFDAALERCKGESARTACLKSHAVWTDRARRVMVIMAGLMITVKVGIDRGWRQLHVEHLD